MPTDADCIRAVYLGAPDDNAQVADIPADVLLTPDTDGRYVVQRGQQVTVVTAAPLPAGWTRFYLQQTPLGTPSPVSTSQLIQPVGTTYTFTVSEEADAPARFTSDLTAARPLPRPGQKPELGDVVVTTVFQAPRFTYNSFDTTGAATAAGSYAFLMPDADNAGSTTAVTTYELRISSTQLRINVTDADGGSSGGFYARVPAGDVLEWLPVEHEECWERYRVKEVLPDPPGEPPRKLFMIEHLPAFFPECDGPINEDQAGMVVELRWNPPPARPGAAGIPVMLLGQPVEGGSTYRAAPFTRLVIDVPSGMRLVRDSGLLLTNWGHYVLALRDFESGSTLTLDLHTGAELERTVLMPHGPRDVGALFDGIAKSARVGP